MCKYYHPELAGCCYAQKNAPKVFCKGERCNCELSDDMRIAVECSKYLIKKHSKNGTITKGTYIIPDDELIFTLANIADEFVFDDTTSVLIMKSNINSRANDGKDDNE